MRIQGKVAIVTGSGQGIGEATALRLAEEGANLVLADIIDAIDKVAEKISAMGRGVLPVKTDIADRDQVQAMVETTAARFGQVDILVNNAAIHYFAPIESMTAEQWDSVINVNLKGTFNCIQAAVPYMKERRYGKIVSIVSHGIYGAPRSASYAASKGGIVALTRTAALELGQYSINVNAIAPGLIVTPTSTKTLSDDRREGFLRTTPLGRLGKPSDIANLVLFLASDEASFITGQTILCCGGRSVSSVPW